MPEEILVKDDVQRRFQYRITASVFAFHRGMIDVIDLGDDTCMVVYSTDADPRAMALTIGGATAGALDELRRQMESDGRGSRLMGRKILLVTSDQQRYDTLGCNGGTVARTPVIDGLAAQGHRYERAPSADPSCACRHARRSSPASTRARMACG